MYYAALSRAFLRALYSRSSLTHAIACTLSAGSLTLTGCGGSSTGGSTGEAPSVSLTASPSAVDAGGQTTLSWDSSNASSCTASGGWSGAQPTSGSTSTAALSATTNYTLTCSGAGGSKSASATVTVMGAAAFTVKPRVAPLTLSQTQQFTAAGSASLTWSVDGVTGGNPTVGTISSSGLYKPGSAYGTHTIVATNSSDTTQSGTATVAVTNLDGIFTRHVSSAREGLNLQEYALTTRLVGTSGAFGKLWSCAVDGDMYAQPLYVANLAIGKGVHNVVFVATEHDSVYALDADSTACVVYWQSSFVNGTTVTPVPPAIPYQSNLSSSYDIITEIGITGTPVISTALNTLYVVAKTQETDQSGNVTYHDRLHALSLATGGEQQNSPVDITATASTNAGGTINFTSLTQNQRPALLLSNYAGGSAVYVAWASYGDIGSYNGWVIAYDSATLAQVGAWNATPNGTLGGIWLAGGGIAADSGGALYLSTGNGTFDDTSNLLPPLAPNNDFGESFVKLDPSSLAVTDYYAPSQTAAWTAKDSDLSSSGVTVLPDGIGPSDAPNLLVGSDKEGHLWLINRDLMSGYSPGSDNTVQYLTMPYVSYCNSNCTFSTPAYYRGTVYIGMRANRVMAFTLSGGLFAESGGTATPAAQTSDIYEYPGPTPAISASPTGNAIMWVLDTSQNGTWKTSAGPAILRAYDATQLGAALYSSSNAASDTAGNAIKYSEPVIANGHAYIAGSHQLTVYGPEP
jgi:hypothetical protein